MATVRIQVDRRAGPAGSKRTMPRITRMKTSWATSSTAAGARPHISRATRAKTGFSYRRTRSESADGSPRRARPSVSSSSSFAIPTALHPAAQARFRISSTEPPAAISTRPDGAGRGPRPRQSMQICSAASSASCGPFLLAPSGMMDGSRTWCRTRSTCPGSTPSAGVPCRPPRSRRSRPDTVPRSRPRPGRCGRNPGSCRGSSPPPPGRGCPSGPGRPRTPPGPGAVPRGQASSPPSPGAPGVERPSGSPRARVASSAIPQSMCMLCDTIAYDRAAPRHPTLAGKTAGTKGRGAPGAPPHPGLDTSKPPPVFHRYFSCPPSACVAVG